MYWRAFFAASYNYSLIKVGGRIAHEDRAKEFPYMLATHYLEVSDGETHESARSYIP